MPSPLSTPRTLLPVLTALALALLGLTLPGAARAGGTPVGTVITNQASATAAGELYLSPAVDTVVRAQCAVAVTPDGTSAQPAYRVGIAPGGESVLPYRLVNTGNVDDAFTLSWQVSPGSAFAPSAARVVRDLNSNGVPDSGEPVTDRVALPVDASADLLLIVQAPADATGTAFMGLVGGCVSSSGSAHASDSGNVAAVRVNGGAELQIEKSFMPPAVAPGGTTQVTVRVRNLGNKPSEEADVTDPLGTPALRGLSLLGGTQSAPTGRLSVLAAGSDTVTWRVPSLLPGQVVSMTFQMQAAPDATPGTRVNVATLVGGGVTLQAEANVQVTARPGVNLGPAGNPAALPGGEGSRDDLQLRPFTVLGQPGCFAHTVQNTGNVADRVTLSGEFTLGQGTLTWRDAQGAPLAQPLNLAPGEQRDVQACLSVTVAGSDGARALLSAASEAGAPVNRTEDAAPLVDPRAPELVKTVTPAGTVPVGQVLTYTLRATNPYDSPLTDVTLRDPLPEGLTFLDASDGGTLDSFTRTVVWGAGTLAPGQTRAVTLRARVNADVPDDTVVRNVFTLASGELPSPVSSPAAPSHVYSSALLISKAAAPTTVTTGDRVTFTVTVRNGSRVSDLSGGTLLDTPPAGLEFIAGTAAVDGRPAPDPAAQSGGGLLWTVGALPAGATRTLTYAMRVTPLAGESLVNVAVANMQAPQGAQIGSAEARARVKVTPGIFTPNAELNGQVFIDRNRDGRFTSDLDTPVQGARVLLAGGRSALTDQAGRYHFGAVPRGPQVLRLDPQSVRNEPLSVPQDGGLSGTRSVVALNLTSVDFPLAPGGGDVYSVRDTTVRRGDVTLRKQVTWLGDTRYRVRVTVTSPAALPGLEVADPLPTGAVLTDGQSGFTVDFAGGSMTNEYSFTFSGTPEQAGTDPYLRWRLP
ncbi:DUF7927 domain-containing protein [Deinococcus knuensis]|uniref:DUF11 domain-containing protein n=1 Tax=Deinococcus knuensis TaxID=1837380 RepID=A0ABQ2SPA1_9DEIO|nr:DUF11 domain-containing protein [Deinococcus knuensis]GGS35506.1 hypothetical protein GCM10008961_29000 [Deinococcus knuensis]